MHDLWPVQQPCDVTIAVSGVMLEISDVKVDVRGVIVEVSDVMLEVVTSS